MRGMNALRTLWRRSGTFIAARKELQVALTALLFIGVLYLDRQTGTEIGVSLFYAGPVFLSSFYLGPAAGCGLALLGGIVWFVLNGLPLMATRSNEMIPVWNAIIRTCFFLLTVSLAQLYRRLSEVKQVNELKSQMLSLVSHDLNNFTTVLKMATAILKDTEKTPAPNRVAAYEALNNNIEKIATTVGDFLDMARLESGRFELKLQRVMLRDFTRKVADDFVFALKKKDLALELDFPKHAIPVRADPGVMTMVMGNLLSNAVKYTPQGGRVTVRLRKLDEHRAEVSVEDTGVGIPPADQKQIFSGFYRTQIGKSVAGGQGLGLKLTKEMVALHGGTLQVESSPERGSRFFFTLSLWKGQPPGQQAFSPD